MDDNVRDIFPRYSVARFCPWLSPCCYDHSPLDTEVALVTKLGGLCGSAAFWKLWNVINLGKLWKGVLNSYVQLANYGIWILQGVGETPLWNSRQRKKLFAKRTQYNGSLPEKAYIHPAGRLLRKLEQCNPWPPRQSRDAPIGPPRACVNTRSSTAQRLMLAGWQPATRSTPLPAVADGHRQPCNLCSSSMVLDTWMRNCSDGLSAGFHLSFPCTMNVTAIATMHIVLHLESKTTGRRVDGSPLAFSLRKRCEAATPNIGLYAAYFSTSRKPPESVNRRLSRGSVLK